MFSEVQFGQARSSLLELLSELRGVRDFTRGDSQVRRALASVSGSSLLREPLRFAAGRYTRTLVYRTLDFEVLLLAWDERSASPIHDHNGQACWFMPLAGSFDAHDYAVTDGGAAPGPGRVEHRGTRTLSAGQIDHAEGAGGLHRVCVSDGCLAAVSLHVYARPIESCLIFDEKRHCFAQKSLGYDAIARLS